VRWLPPQGAPAEDDREMPPGPRTRTLAVCLLAALATAGGLAGEASAAKRTLWRQHRAEHAIRQREKEVRRVDAGIQRDEKHKLRTIEAKQRLEHAVGRELERAAAEEPAGEGQPGTERERRAGVRAQLRTALTARHERLAEDIQQTEWSLHNEVTPRQLHARRLTQEIEAFKAQLAALTGAGPSPGA